MTEAVPDVVQGVPILDTQHPPSDAVAEHVGGDIFGVPSPREVVRADTNAASGPLDDIVNSSPSHPSGLLAGHQGRRVVDASLKILSKRGHDPQRATPIELEGDWWRDAVIGVVLLDRRRKSEWSILEVKLLHRRPSRRCQPRGHVALRQGFGGS